MNIIDQYKNRNSSFRIRDFKQTEDPLLCVGMFGVCDTTTFRQEKFIPRFEKEQIKYYNPQVGRDEWNSVSSPIEESKHLASDQVILFPITRDSYAIGSLSESGFSIIQGISLNNRRHIIALIDLDLNESLLEDNPDLAEVSIRGRVLVYQHLRKLRLPNIYLVDTLDEMLEAAVLTYKTCETLNPLNVFNPHKKLR